MARRKPRTTSCSAAPAEWHFGRWLRAEIRAAGLQVLDVAVMASIGRCTLFRWFAQERPGIQERNVEKLADLLGIDEREITRRTVPARTWPR